MIRKIYKNSFSYFILGSLILCIILLWNTNRKNIRIINKIESDFENFATYFLGQYKLFHSSINGSTLLQNIDGQLLTIRDLSEHKSLIFYHPGNLCEDCYQEVFNEFANVSKKANSKINIVLISKFHNLRSAKIAAKKLKIKNEIYTIDTPDLNIIYHNQLVPYFFVLDSTLIKKYLLIPDKNTPGVVNFYLSIINRTFNKKTQ